jgi:hypothetical protein
VKNKQHTEKRADLLRQAHAIVDEAEKRGSWTNDDQAKHDKIIGEIREIDGTVDTRGFPGGLTQVGGGERRDESPLLTREQSLADHVAEQRGFMPGVDDGLGERSAAHRLAASEWSESESLRAYLMIPPGTAEFEKNAPAYSSAAIASPIAFLATPTGEIPTSPRPKPRRWITSRESYETVPTPVTYEP